MANEALDPTGWTEADWRRRLDAAEFAVLRQAATEPPHTGRYVHETAAGRYACRGCGAKLFDSSTKFDSHCGWPSFHSAIEGSVVFTEDRSLGLTRVEVTCANCGGHLGHRFDGEGYGTPTDQRFCINSVSLELNREDA
jgi:peptide-methionine (R)-S-oxide reductase